MTDTNEANSQSEKDKKIEKWLPITSSRNAKWWFSAFHNVTAMVGAGVLSLPYAMSELGWYVRFVSLLGSNLLLSTNLLFSNLVLINSNFHSFSDKKKMKNKNCFL